MDDKVVFKNRGEKSRYPQYRLKKNLNVKPSEKSV